ncbi:MAG TPA: HAD family phosphatase [Candidatus Cloacimonetes bacterium]|nr:HAD family phosphatase [Candidatus Cloacimonadota bacterium]HEX37989.1 HAD family phosphatase [Candidatus Cloacimonadota bacterium]
MPKSKYKALIFDLGNVIIDISPKKCCDHWAKLTGKKPEELYITFPFDEIYAQFERGEIPADTFRTYVSECLGIELTKKQFDEGWSRILIQVRKNIPQLLKKLSHNYRLVALSNTNEIHVPMWQEMCEPILPYFEHIFSSNEIGFRKPESSSFQHVLEYLELTPGEVLFLDDNRENIIAAKNYGFRTICVESYEQMVNELKKLRII